MNKTIEIRVSALEIEQCVSKVPFEDEAMIERMNRALPAHLFADLPITRADEPDGVVCFSADVKLSPIKRPRRQ